MTAAPRVLVLDNRDSFVFNLVDDFARRGATVRTVRGEQPMAAWLGHLQSFAPDLVVLSPGPGHPESAGVMVPWLRSRPPVPCLGVCLGHQALAVAAGGRLGVLPQPLHGRASPLRTTDDALFADLPQPLQAARYHSLFVAEVPEAMMPIAWTRHGEQEVCMAMRHRRLPWVGVQFHPESILTPHGSTLLERVLAEAVQRTTTQNPTKAPS